VALIHLLTSKPPAPPTPSDAAAPGAAPRAVKRPKLNAAGGGSPAGVRVLVVAHTNVAVDRVLLGLAGEELGAGGPRRC
jgi:hypothetical protein